MQAFTSVAARQRSMPRLPRRMRADAKFIAGGTDLMQLLKDNVETPAQLVDLERVGLSRHSRSMRPACVSARWRA